MQFLSFIRWDIGPSIIESPINLRYYSLLFGVAFLVGYTLMKKMMQKENAPEAWLDKIFLFVFIGTVIGARLGHVFFYEWDYYKEHLSEIPKIWEGGLASHGALIGILLALYFYSKKVTKKSMLWAADKVVVTIAIAACLIRFGNLMNSEIIGSKSETSSAFFFEYQAKHNVQNILSSIDQQKSFDIHNIQIELDEKVLDTLDFNYPTATLQLTFIPQNTIENPGKQIEWITHSFSSFTRDRINSPEYHFFTFNSSYSIQSINDTYLVSIPIGIIPRIPTQIWEAIAYLFIFVLLLYGYWKRHWYEKEGLLLGLFLILLFAARFIIEFWKEHQTLEGGALLNMGQWLSLPAIAVGMFFVLRAVKKGQNPSTSTTKTE